MINDKESWYGPFRHFLIASACTFHVETSRRQAKFDHLTLIKGPLGVTSVSKIGLTIYTWLLGMTSNHWFIVQSHSSSLVTLKMLESRAPLLAAEAWHLPNVHFELVISLYEKNLDLFVISNCLYSLLCLQGIRLYSNTKPELHHLAWSHRKSVSTNAWMTNLPRKTSTGAIWI